MRNSCGCMSNIWITSPSSYTLMIVPFDLSDSESRRCVDTFLCSLWPLSRQDNTTNAPIASTGRGIKKPSSLELLQFAPERKMASFIFALTNNKGLLGIIRVHRKCVPVHFLEVCCEKTLLPPVQPTHGEITSFIYHFLALFFQQIPG